MSCVFGENWSDQKLFPTFIGPNSTGLKLKHVMNDADEHASSVSILDKYCVTEKADGQRCILFVDKKGKIYLISLKENIVIKEQLDMQSKMLITLFSLFAEIERDLVSYRTKEALSAIKQRGKRLGRPKGSTGKCVLDDKEDQIKKLVELRVSHSAIGRMFNVNRATVDRFVKNKNFKPLPNPKYK